MQHRRKAWHDCHIKFRLFNVGEKVLVYDSRYYKFPGKLQIRWLGLFQIVEVFDNGSLCVQDMNHKYQFKVNDLCVKHYFE